MSSFKDISGVKFNSITALFPTERRVNGVIVWRCKCDCGKEIEVSRSNLVSGNTKSCGCKRGHSTGIAAKNITFYAYKNNAKHRGIEFSLSESEFLNLVSKNCFYCGKPPSNKTHRNGYKGDFTYNGIDRLDNIKGYTVVNCVPCCKICNRAKNNLSYEEFMGWLFGICRSVVSLERFGGKHAARIIS